MTRDTRDTRDTIEDRIAAVLREEPNAHWCDGCLALAAKFTLVEAQAAFAALNGDTGFQVAQGTCSSCQRNKIVLCAGRQARTR